VSHVDPTIPYGENSKPKLPIRWRIRNAADLTNIRKHPAEPIRSRFLLIRADRESIKRDFKCVDSSNILFPRFGTEFSRECVDRGLLYRNVAGKESAGDCDRIEVSILKSIWYENTDLSYDQQET